MRNFSKKTFLVAAVALSMTACKDANETKSTLHLWYNEPATAWTETLPIGNGRLGAMIHGGVEQENLELNESTMWSGEYDENQQKPFGREKMQSLRKLFFEGNLEEGNRIAGSELPGTPHSFGTHLPIGSLKMDFTYPEGEKTGYQRSLNLNDAVSEVTYRVGDVQYKREYFSTNPDDVMVLRISADKPGAVTFNLSLDLLRKAAISTNNNELVFTGKVDFPMHGKGGVEFEGRIAAAVDGGTLKAENSQLSINGSNAVTLYIDVRTDYKNPGYGSLCRETIQKAQKKSYKELRQAHIKDYAALFNRVDLSLGATDAQTDVPTNVRREAVRNGQPDPALDVLFFQYGRYLLIASSRENSPLPVALQGFFNDNQACHMGWTNDYHLDINTQQNYWIANVGNLAECNAPLFDYIKDLSIHGAKTAEVVYGCQGWTAHTTANIWGYTPSSGSIYWGLFPTASSWLASHLWTQYEYTQDSKYLEQVAYPLLRSNARFLLDYMTIDPRNGYLVSGPSISPENGFRYNGKEYCASMMPTCDRVLAYEIFSSCLQATGILGVDQPFADSLRTAIAKLPPLRIGANGGVQEWFEDYEEAHPNHRHTTHLLAFYPYSQITLDQTPELAAASRKTIELRLAAPDWEDTEWSRANMICFYARLKDAAKAYESINILEGKLTGQNLLSVSPAGIAGAQSDIYAFDGNTAGSAGMAEMLIQNHEGYVEFLPCLPAAWKDGSFKGLCIRGGAEASAQWKDSKLTKASLKATANHAFTIRIPQDRQYSLLLNGKEAGRPDQQGLCTVELKKGDLLEIK